jgi:hypothetical protein
MTVFAGTLPAVDRRLMELGRLAALRTAADVAAIRFERKPHGLSLRAPDLKHHIVQELVA